MSGTYLTFDIAKLRKMGGSPIQNGQYATKLDELKSLEAKYGAFSTRTDIHPDDMGGEHLFSESFVTFGPLANIVSHSCDYVDLGEAMKSGGVYDLVKDITDTTALHLIIESIKNTADMYGQAMPPLYLCTGDKSAKLN